MCGSMRRWYTHLQRQETIEINASLEVRIEIDSRLGSIIKEPSDLEQVT